MCLFQSVFQSHLRVFFFFLKKINGSFLVISSVLHVTRPLHTTQQRSAPLPPLPEKGGEVRHGLIPEEFFQFLYPKTGVTG